MNTIEEKGSAMISIKITSGNETVEINLPKENNLLKETKLEELDLDDPFFDVSSKLRKNKKFIELFKQSLEQFNFSVNRSTKLQNGLIVNADGSYQTTINDVKWKKVERLAFKGIFKENVEMLIIHVSGGLDDEYKDQIIDRIYNQLPPIPIHQFKTKRKDQTMLIEIITFGTESLQEEFDY